MYRISQLCPLFFKPSTDVGVKSKYIQQFSRTDEIHLQIFADRYDSAPMLTVYNVLTGSGTTVDPSLWELNDSDRLYFFRLCGMDVGYYRLYVAGMESEPFHVSDDVAGTVLIQYSMKDNRQSRDALFWISGMQYFFDFRVPGGFKDSDWSFTVENEQYVTSENDVLDIYSSASTQYTLTVGDARGCPVWFASLLNNLLSCTYVYIDGVRYVRKDSSTPEINAVMEGINSFFIKQSLQKVRYLDPTIEDMNRLSMRRVNSEWRFTDENKPRVIL
jgi:hypothetical protein